MANGISNALWVEIVYGQPAETLNLSVKSATRLSLWAWQPLFIAQNLQWRPIDALAKPAGRPVPAPAGVLHCDITGAVASRTADTSLKRAA